MHSESNMIGHSDLLMDYDIAYVNTTLIYIYNVFTSHLINFLDIKWKHELP